MLQKTFLLRTEAKEFTTNRTTNYMFWAIEEAEGEVGIP